MSDRKSTTVALPATAWKGFGRGAQWTVASGRVTGHGDTLGAARTRAAATVADLLANVTTPPAFARDDDGSLIVAVAHGSGVLHYRVTGDRAREVSFCDGPPAESLARVPHYTPLTG